jgi:pimeloyl-ACP methyl ester carboxylesterase
MDGHDVIFTRQRFIIRSKGTKFFGANIKTLDQVTVQGRSLYYRTGKKGIDPALPNLLLIHGAGGSHQNWLNQLVGLEVPVNILALDLPGHGQSAGPGEETIAGYSGYILEFIQAWPKSRWIVGGHSMGSAIALECALNPKIPLWGLILVSTGARMPVNEKIISGLAEDPASWIKKIVRWCYPPDADSLLVEGGIALMQAAPPELIRDDFRACNAFNRENDLQAVQIPTLILCGEKDLMTPPAYSRLLNEQISGSELRLIPGAGHMPMIEKPDLFNRAVQTFISHFR